MQHSGKIISCAIKSLCLKNMHHAAFRVRGSIVYSGAYSSVVTALPKREGPGVTEVKVAGEEEEGGDS